MSGHRHETLVDYVADCEVETGRVLRAEFRAHSNAGCSLDISPVFAFQLCHRTSGAYSFKDFDTNAKVYRTNTVSNTPFR